MTRQRLRLGLATVAMSAVVGYVLLRHTASAHRINEASLKLIQPGMTQADVEKVLGVPPGDYSHGGCVLDPFLDPPEDNDGRNWIGRLWIGEEVAVFVFFDVSGNVANARKHLVQRNEQSFLAKIRRWLGVSGTWTVPPGGQAPRPSHAYPPG